MHRILLRGLVAVAIVSVVAACGSAADQSAQARKQATATDAPSPAVPATGGPGYSAALSARLVTPESLPPGFTVEIATTMALDAGDRRPDVGAACAPSMIPLLSARRLTGSPSATAAATLSFDAGPDDLWVGTEVLRTYTDDGARRAMADLRTFIGGCPTLVLPDQDGSYRFAVAAGPRLGDDSLHLIQATTSRLDTLEWDVILVRAGTSLVVVQSEGNKPGGVEHLNRVAEAAVHRFQTTGS